MIFLCKQRHGAVEVVLIKTDGNISKMEKGGGVGRGGTRGKPKMKSYVFLSILPLLGPNIANINLSMIDPCLEGTLAIYIYTCKSNIIFGELCIRKRVS